MVLVRVDDKTFFCKENRLSPILYYWPSIQWNNEHITTDIATTNSSSDWIKWNFTLPIGNCTYRASSIYILTGKSATVPVSYSNTSHTSTSITLYLKLSEYNNFTQNTQWPAAVIITISNLKST